MEQIVGISLSPTIDYSQTWEIVSREINDAVTCHYIIQIQDQYKQLLLLLLRSNTLAHQPNIKMLRLSPANVTRRHFIVLD